VSGTVVAGRPDNLAAIETGTFDPGTGALKLQGNAKHPETGAPIRYAIEGTLANGTLSVSAAFGPDFKGDFKLTQVPASPAQVPRDAGAALRNSFEDVSKWIAMAAEIVPAESYSYRPVPTVRTFGELVGHVADACNFACSHAAGRPVPWSDDAEKGPTDKASLAPKLKRALDGCTAAYAKSGDPGALLDNVGHTNLHYGNMITYIRMLGLVPPSSR
jgi:DinB family protein